MKRGKIKITYECLLDALKIKEGIEVEHVTVDVDSRTVTIYVKGSENTKELPTLNEGDYIPFVNIEVMTNSKEILDQ